MKKRARPARVSSAGASSFIDRMSAARARLMAAADALPPITEFEWPMEMTPDHPIAKAIGFEKAKALSEVPTARRSARATHRRKEVERLSRKGLEVKKIAAKVGLHPDYVVHLRRDLGLGHGARDQRVARHLAEVRRLNALGWNDSEIAAEIGCSRSHVCVIRRKHDIPANLRKP
ncbi:hypothetical protein [Novosphingobium aquimarinum]|uniref:hypothetical protein n=1 Tax=Novosphingobium aquimarinum TaxID=2682494 RepID=UPI0012EC0FA0|nr:hypothetical protein [Novosphingobium aquimarinum]